MKIGSLMAIGVGLLGMCGPASAGGSVSYAEVRGKIPVAVRDHLEASFELAKVGGATRLGRHFKELGGARIGPYVFEGSSKLTGLGGYEVTILTSVEFVDAAGAVTEDPEKASGVNESFVRYEVASSAMGGGPGDVGLPPALSVAAREEAIALARGSYNEVVDADLKFVMGAFERDEVSGSVRRGYTRDGRLLRKVELQAATGDHGGFKVEVFCDARAIPSFVLWEESYWRFDPEDQDKTIDHITERRFYFSPSGQLARSLEKSFQGSGEAELSDNRKRAQNVDYPADPKGVAMFFRALKQLTTASDAELLKLVDEFLAAGETMGGSGAGGEGGH